MDRKSLKDIIKIMDQRVDEMLDDADDKELDEETVNRLEALYALIMEAAVLLGFGEEL